MIDKTSRYAKVPIETASDDEGSEMRLLGLRPVTTVKSVFEHTPSGAERLDHISHRYFRDSTKFWRIADASDELDPFDLVVPGRPIPIPPDR